MILVATVAVWFLQRFDLRLQVVEDSAQSILAALSALFVPVLKPLGLGDWRIATSLFSGIIAKESVVSILEVLFKGMPLQQVMTPAAAMAMLVFCLIYSPCIAAIASIRRELGHRWAIGVVVWQCVLAWMLSLLTYLLFCMVW